MIYSPGQKNLLTLEGKSTIITHTNYSESRFKPNFPIKGDLKG
jgi:hypothetical protein